MRLGFEHGQSWREFRSRIQHPLHDVERALVVGGRDHAEIRFAAAAKVAEHELRWVEAESDIVAGELLCFRIVKAAVALESEGPSAERSGGSMSARGVGETVRHRGA
jgi:hypothetical protein